MADGHLNKCKSCTRRDVTRYSRANPGKKRAYEWRRWNTPRRRRYAAEQQRLYRARNRGKAWARNAVSNAIRDGRLVRGPCLFCGTARNVQAHHHDYRKPLSVTWACFRCHREKMHGQKVA